MRKPRPIPAAAVREWPADKVERWPVAKLTPYARNARTHSDEQVAQIAASLRKWGWTVPVLVDEQGGLIAGHGRVLAAAELGLDEIPVMIARGWTETQRRAYALADNKLPLNAGWDENLLRIELADLREMGAVSLTGFSGAEMEALLGAPLVTSTGSPPGGGGSGGYKEQYGVIVVCRDEPHQQEVFERLSAEGLEVKVVAT